MLASHQHRPGAAKVTTNKPARANDMYFTALPLLLRWRNATQLRSDRPCLTFKVLNLRVCPVKSMSSLAEQARFHKHRGSDDGLTLRRLWVHEEP
jgi:hypothetical protein